MRPVVYATIGILLLILAGVGIRQSANWRVDAEARERDRAQERLDQLVAAWENYIDERVRFSLPLLASDDTSPAVVEASLRAKLEWVDSVYVWEPGDLVFPGEPFPENLSAMQSTPCIARAMAATGGEDEMLTAQRYLNCQKFGDRQLLLYSTSQAAELLLEADHPELADAEIRRIAPLPAMQIWSAADYRVNASRLVELRLQHARAERALGREDVAERWLAGMKSEILGLDGPTLHSLLEIYTQEIKPQLSFSTGDDGGIGGPGNPGLDDDDPAEAKAKRRLAVWKMVGEHDWQHAEVPTVDEGPKLFTDSSTDPPGLLYVARLEVGHLYGGIQVDQIELLRTLYRLAGKLGPHLTIRGPDGDVLAGSKAPVSVYRPFGHLMPSLLVGITEGALPKVAADITLYAQLSVIAIGMLVGAFALITLVRTDREQLSILARQREFMTRVTHELKTPLAGIRVIAENLEMGAYRDTEQVESYARIIIAEAERLGLRVDEVIKAANGPAREDARGLDLSKVLSELVETWRERYAATGTGATIELDTPQALPMHGKGSMLRDAVTNLLDNALKYRRDDRPLRVRVRARVAGRFVIIEVEDNGMGIPAAMRKAVFEKFRRVEGAGRGLSGGHGLGLSFVSEAAQLHRGTIECGESRTGGSTFVMRVRRES
ncbi:MAG: HAMP domain-containing histidine kinase [Myxococcales bacterium]|nr:HAMP domain-containing histidine kinase [Myxococcales bacterium]